jgi:hypothetical protein
MAALLGIGGVQATLPRHLLPAALGGLLWAAVAVGSACLILTRRNGSALALCTTWLLGLGLLELVAHQRDLLKASLQDGVVAGAVAVTIVAVLWRAQTTCRNVMEAWRSPSWGRALVLIPLGVIAACLFRSQVWVPATMLVLPHLAASLAWACQRTQRVATPKQWLGWWGPVASSLAAGMVPLLSVHDWAPVVALVGTFAVLAVACGEKVLGLAIGLAWVVLHASIRWMAGSPAIQWVSAWKPVARTLMVVSPEWAPNAQVWLYRLALAHGGLAGEGLLPDWGPIPLASTDGIVPCWGLQFGWAGITALLLAVSAMFISWAAAARRAATPTAAAFAWHGALFFALMWVLTLAPLAGWPFVSSMGLAAPLIARGAWASFFWLTLAGTTMVLAQYLQGREAFAFRLPAPRLVPQSAQAWLVRVGAAFVVLTLLRLAWLQTVGPSAAIARPAHDVQSERQAIVLRDAGYVVSMGSTVEPATGRSLEPGEASWFLPPDRKPERLYRKVRKFVAAGVYVADEHAPGRVFMRSDRAPFIMRDPWESRSLREENR